MSVLTYDWLSRPDIREEDKIMISESDVLITGPQVMNLITLQA